MTALSYEQTDVSHATPVTTNSFAKLVESEDILTRLSTLSITTATPVQEAAIPEANRGHDLIVQAQTGSGKTLAYVLPLIQKLRSQGPVVVPLVKSRTQVVTLKVGENVPDQKRLI